MIVLFAGYFSRCASGQEHTRNTLFSDMKLSCGAHGAKLQYKRPGLFLHAKCSHRSTQLEDLLSVFRLVGGFGGCGGRSKCACGVVVCEHGEFVCHSTTEQRP